MKNYISIKNAKEHNLKSVSIDIPRDKFVVITGLSGSGKSSLAFDTIYAEGQRRYVESLSAYARQFLGQMEKPSVESIEGLSPAISIDQKTTSKNPRSTVGTVTEIYDYLRLLYARVGTPHCPECGIEISPSTVDQIVDKVLKLEPDTKIQILAPIVKGKKGTHAKLISALIKEGYVRGRINSQTITLDEAPALDKNKKHNIDIVIDRIIIKEGIESRVTDSIETALRLAEGSVVIELLENEGSTDLLFNTQFACPEHGKGIAEMEPRMFSFNAPFGACPDCNGIGYIRSVDPTLVVPDTSISVQDGAIVPLANSNEDSYYVNMINTVIKSYGESPSTPFCDLTKELQEAIFYGTGQKEITFSFESKFGSGYREVTKPFEGIINNLQRRYMETNSEYMKSYISEFMSDELCKTCHGERLKDEVLAVKVGGLNISGFTKMSITNALSFVESLSLPGSKSQIASQILKEITERLYFLKNLGLDYLTLSRAASTLSGGESQRIRLATQIGSGLVGVLYILDEPSIGLHQKDNEKLIKALRRLTDLGNTLLVVEHDEDTMRESDYIIDMGPGAGEHGGEVTAFGTVEELIKNPNSLTGKYLSGEKFIKLPELRRKGTSQYIKILGASENNLKDIDVDFPLGTLTCVTGVSGSGKSTLINEILFKAASQKLSKTRERAGQNKAVLGLENVDKVIGVDQSPIGRTPRSNPATYTGVFDKIRDVFAATSEAKQKGYQKGRFSFNVSGGRCEHCKGDGIIKIEMHFLPDVYVECDVCKGKRYNRETLQVKYKGKNISDVLNMTVEESLEFFENIPSIKKRIQTLADVGLGYIKLGQPSTQLSGGEAQRVKIALELARPSTGKTLYILDEPTTGLHTADVDNLINVIQRLVDGGNTAVVIEHNLDVIKCSDYIIDLGPDGGDKGGQLVASGTPEQVAKVSKSYTGQFLKKILEK